MSAVDSRLLRHARAARRYLVVAVLLGLAGTVVIAHGASRARGVTSACLLAADLEELQTLYRAAS